jgi:hypothetical protein
VQRSHGNIVPNSRNSGDSSTGFIGHSAKPQNQKGEWQVPPIGIALIGHRTARVGEERLL